MSRPVVAQTIVAGPPSATTTASRRGVAALFCVLFVLHHDWWWWADRRLVFGILPVGLAYHAAFSLAAGLLWALASRYAWPDSLERWAGDPDVLATSPGPGEVQSQ